MPMSSFVARCAAVALSLALAPLPCRADNVLYSTTERDLAPPGAVFLDRNGDLYPDADVEIPVEDLQVEAENPYETLSLKGYYRREAAAGRATWRALLASVGVAEAPGGFDTTWTHVQDRLRARAVGRIDALSGPARRPVFLLVQGFNNTFLEAHDWYRRVRRDVLARQPDAVIIEVLWDGGTHPFAAPVWWVGQNNFRFAGLSLRRIIRDIAPETPLRIISHSSGGPAVANALGDASAPFLAGQDADAERHERYFERAGARTGPYAPGQRRDLRIAMIVPAGAPNTFSRFSAGVSTLPQRLIIGQNERDYAVTKAGLGCAKGGDTCLAVQLDAFCSTRRHLRRLSPGMQVLGFDMSRSANGTSSPKLGFREDHAMTAYVLREDWPKILDALLADTPAADELSGRCGS
ncbi:hypothetical protein [Lysobacter humi (ex Lee et al. 2017)]